ncbi:hypothetical protein IscW_ISCW024037 [Ixodes scapularis]|uniref:Uncharacterized protein n=1 Tax=Ixodes scapularis TaxID=6945 RepID=B7P2Z2_IXOSC|nr:hypothetical protein IscW_ISCW024037 [Ixodes scapularis]|eukprot:XP_002403189.1 hypothetical protein IscW_ISCW024037 [Ixodes scapularis]
MCSVLHYDGHKCYWLLATGSVPSCSETAYVLLETMSVHVPFLHLTAHSPFCARCPPKHSLYLLQK